MEKTRNRVPEFPKAQEATSIVCSSKSRRFSADKSLNCAMAALLCVVSWPEDEVWATFSAPTPAIPSRPSSFLNRFTTKWVRGRRQPHVVESVQRHTRGARGSSGSDRRNRRLNVTSEGCLPPSSDVQPAEAGTREPGAATHRSPVTRHSPLPDPNVPVTALRLRGPPPGQVVGSKTAGQRKSLQYLRPSLQRTDKQATFTQHGQRAPESRHLPDEIES